MGQTKQPDSIRQVMRFFPPSAPQLPHPLQTCLTGPEGRTSVQKEVKALMQAYFARLRAAAQVRGVKARA